MINKHVSLNLNVRGLGQSATLSVNDRIRTLKAEGKTVYRLGLGQSPFPIPQSIVESLRTHAHERDYLPAKGHADLRAAVADYHRRTDGVAADSEGVLIGPGSKELMFILQLVFYGELLVPAPCWVSYIPQAKIIGRQVSLIQTALDDGYMISAKRLEEHCAEEKDDLRPRILVLNYPNNPVGSTYTADELEKLAAVARKYQVILLSDEIYAQLDHKGAHVSVARYYPEGTIISSGLSKWCGAGGWRLGTFTFPKDLDWLLDKMASVASETYTSVSAPIQFAAIRAFEGGELIYHHLRHYRRILEAVGKRCAGILNRAGIGFIPPTGGFYIFADFSKYAEALAAKSIHGSPDLANRLIEETGVAVIPGAAFGRPKEELSARLAYVDFDGAGTLAASESIPLETRLSESFVDEYCPKVVQAFQIISDWVRA
ncbi:MAG: aminotransferase class I/II-fold pyridoxal phosphate-dependent enzyme [Candidatus Eisenbacteria bacterium]|nr:aminotransferase class I/II-fold pyridoxal phosphate-dependent enzyme [Candidatus Eisenbacteria bacterium]